MQNVTADTLGENTLRCCPANTDLGTSRLPLEGTIGYITTDRRTWIFVHGLGCSSESFTALYQSLEEQLPTIKNDRIHFYNAPRKADHIPELGDGELFRNMAKGILGDLGMDSEIYIVTHSMGGVVGIELAEHLGDRVIGFLNIEGNLTKNDCGLLSTRISRDADGVGLENLIKKFSMTGYPGEIMWTQTVREYDYAALNSYAKQLVASSRKGRLLRRYNSLRCKTLFVHGDDYLRGRKRARNYALRYIQPEKRVYLRGAGHFAMQDNPKGLAMVISKCLT